jgi:transposase InsO family protein
MWHIAMPEREPSTPSMADNGSPFVNTLKRDYVRLTPLPDAETALGLIDGWFEDYNENHPHSGLKWRSLSIGIQSGPPIGAQKRPPLLHG